MLSPSTHRLTNRERRSGTESSILSIVTITGGASNLRYPRSVDRFVPEVSHVIVDYDAVTLARRHVRKDAALEALASSPRIARKLAGQLPRRAKAWSIAPRSMAS